MLNKRSIALIIPCYNEEEGLKTILPKVPQCIDEVIIVDNNSTDNTSDVAKSFGCTVISESIPGYGAAYKCGFSNVSKDIVVTMDGDDTYPIHEIKQIVEILLDHNYDFITCSRFPLMNKSSMNFSNILGNKILTIVTKILFGTSIKDSQSGMWVFKKNIFTYIFPKSDGMPLSQEIKILALQHRKIKFFETNIGYAPRIGEVKLDKWRDGFNNLIFLFKLRFKKNYI
jgi:dolichol-phosphate hexosyltransferase